MIEFLVDFALASNLSLDSNLMSLAVVPINSFRCDATKEVIDFRPFLSGDIELVLHGVSIHDVSENSKFLIFIKVL